jgi:hypothetical protein
MSIQSSTSRIAYVGNASTVTAYVVPFKFFENSELVVVVTTSADVDTTLTLTTDYSVTGAGVDAGGSIVTVVAVPATSTVTIYRLVDATQLTVYSENSEFPASSHENALDKLTMLVQQDARNVGQAFRLRQSDGTIAEMQSIPSTVLGLSSSSVPVFRTSDELKTFLSLSAPITSFPTKVWADAGARALAVPGFEGQVGVQVDTDVIYVATGLTAGSWALQSVTLTMLVDGILTADTAGRLKMADGYITAAKLSADSVTGQTAKTLPADADAFLIWDSAASALKKMVFSNIRTAGAILTKVVGFYSSSAAISAVIPLDNTVPDIGEGTQIISASITPKYANSLIRLRFIGQASAAAANKVSVAIFRVGLSPAIAATYTTVPASTEGAVIVLEREDSPATTSAVTYTVRAGAGSGNIYFNGIGSSGVFSTAGSATLVLEEIKQ